MILAVLAATAGTVVLGLGTALWGEYVLPLKGNALLSMGYAAVVAFGPGACFFILYRFVKDRLDGR